MMWQGLAGVAGVPPKLSVQKSKIEKKKSCTERLGGTPATYANQIYYKEIILYKIYIYIVYIYSIYLNVNTVVNHLGLTDYVSNQI